LEPPRLAQGEAAGAGSVGAQLAACWADAYPMKYELYHDESKEDGYWHGMLLVPIDKKQLLLKFLSKARTNADYSYPLGIKKVKRPGRIYDCAESWVQIGVAALVSASKGLPVPISLAKRIRGKLQYRFFRELMGTKFIVFREKDNLSKMSDFLDYGGKVETTFRMGLKGGLHFLGSEVVPICVEKMHFDGHEHHNRHIDSKRIVNRLYGLRPYCSISDRDDLIDDRSSDHTRSTSQDYEDCQLLQLTDLLIGCFRSILDCPTRPIHKKLAYSVESIIQRYFEGYARMQNSRWRNSFCISQCYLDSGDWNFETIEYQREDAQQQLPLF